MSRTINLQPTWPEAVEILMAALENGTGKGQAAARTELRRMAGLLEGFANARPEFEGDAVFEVITTKADGSDAYGVRMTTEAGALDYAETMRRAGYEAELVAVLVQPDASAALEDAGDFYADERLQEESK